jgi:hypothetical protein
MTEKIEKIEKIDVNAQLSIPGEQKDAQQSLAGALASGINWNPLVKLMQFSSNDVKSKKFDAGHYVYNNNLDLGNEVPCWILAIQAAAIEFNNNKIARKSYVMQTKETETTDGTKKIIIVGDKDFSEISSSKDDRDNGISFRWGAEVLMYFPVHKCYGQIFLATISARNSISEFEQLKRRPAILFSEKITNKRGEDFMVPHVKALIGEVDGFHMPSQEGMIDALKKFAPRPTSKPEPTAAPRER